ncbi:kxDL motif-containing protein 1 isoform 2-T3 [Amazona ochrocephala]
MEPTASQVFCGRVLGMVNAEDVNAIILAQKNMLDRFEKTNEMLLNFNNLSSVRMQQMSERFLHHTKTLVEMKKDLDGIFRRIRWAAGVGAVLLLWVGREGRKGEHGMGLEDAEGEAGEAVPGGLQQHPRISHPGGRRRLRPHPEEHHDHHRYLGAEHGVLRHQPRRHLPHHEPGV